MLIPRIGMEVVVEFLEGDPDKPLVTGCVYNGKNKVPYELPENKTRSTFKTDSHQARYNGFNELRFEDKRQSEEVYLRAQKDLSVKVRNNRVEVVDGNEVNFIGRDKVERVRRDKYTSVRGGYSIFVGQDHLSETRSNEAFEANDKLQSLRRRVMDALVRVASGGYTIFVDSFRNTWVGGADTTTVGAAKTTSVGGQYSVVVGGNYQMSSSSRASLTAQTLDITAAQSLHINVGRSRISLKDGEITFSSPSVNIVSDNETNIETNGNNKFTSGGDTKINSGGNADIKAEKINLN